MNKGQRTNIMWIKMLTDQVGPDGIFLKGPTVSVPANILKKLDPDSYIEVDMDEDAMLRLGIEDRLRHLKAESATLDAAVKSTKDRLADLYQRRKVIRTKIRLAENELEGIATQTETQQESKDESDNQEKLSRPPGNIQEGPDAGPASSIGPASAGRRDKSGN